jgi:hypothetical protein
MAFGLRLALIVFSLEVLAGLIHGRVFEATVQSAFFMGGIFWGVGLVTGYAARQTVEELVRSQHQKSSALSQNKTPSPTDKTSPPAGRG